uniref:Secreted protein n=1 Tax=Arundo donax TaxID=35708 RepID=A0A0A9ELV8_ARUDO
MVSWVALQSLSLSPCSAVRWMCSEDRQARVDGDGDGDGFRWRCWWYGEGRRKKTSPTLLQLQPLPPEAPLLLADTTAIVATNAPAPARMMLLFQSWIFLPIFSWCSWDREKQRGNP